ISIPSLLCCRTSPALAGRPPRATWRRRLCGACGGWSLLHPRTNEPPPCVVGHNPASGGIIEPLRTPLGRGHFPQGGDQLVVVLLGVVIVADEVFYHIPREAHGLPPAVLGEVVV